MANCQVAWCWAPAAMGRTSPSPHVRAGHPLVRVKTDTVRWTMENACFASFFIRFLPGVQTCSKPGVSVTTPGSPSHTKTPPSLHRWCIVSVDRIGSSGASSHRGTETLPIRPKEDRFNKPADTTSSPIILADLDRAMSSKTGRPEPRVMMNNDFSMS